MIINEATVFLSFVIGFVLGIIFSRVMENKRKERERLNSSENSNYYKSPAYYRKIRSSNQWDS